MPQTLQTGDTQAICIERADSFIDRCIDLTDAALQRQALARENAAPKPRGKPKKRKAA
jgi:hypothetical protein